MGVMMSCRFPKNYASGQTFRRQQVSAHVFTAIPSTIMHYCHNDFAKHKYQGWYPNEGIEFRNALASLEERLQLRTAMKSQSSSLLHDETLFRNSQAASPWQTAISQFPVGLKLSKSVVRSRPGPFVAPPYPPAVAPHHHMNTQHLYRI